MKTIRIASLLILGAAALSAQAYTLRIEGTIDEFNVVTSTTLRASDLPEFGSTFGYFFNVNGTGALTVANFANGASALSVTNIPGSQSRTNVGGVFTYEGRYVVTSAANVAGVAVGSTGFYTGNFDQNANTFFLNVTSAPGPMAALPFALMALRRRKRA